MDRTEIVMILILSIAFSDSSFGGSGLYLETTPDFTCPSHLNNTDQKCPCSNPIFLKSFRDHRVDINVHELGSSITYEYTMYMNFDDFRHIQHTLKSTKLPSYTYRSKIGLKPLFLAQNIRFFSKFFPNLKKLQFF